jgi:hypothetical protein
VFDGYLPPLIYVNPPLINFANKEMTKTKKKRQENKLSTRNETKGKRRKEKRKEACIWMDAE